MRLEGIVPTRKFKADFIKEKQNLWSKEINKTEDAFSVRTWEDMNIGHFLLIQF